MFSIRRIEPDDVETMAAVIREVMTEYGAIGDGFSIEDPEVDDMYKAYSGDRSAYFVLLDGDEIVGGSGVAPLSGSGPGVCELRKMYFLASARGSGQGRQMMELCLQVAAEMGFRQCYLETLESMNEARGLYERFGFRPLSGPEGATGHSGCDSWYMRELSSPGG
jgi:putative acetyltransferase